MIIFHSLSDESIVTTFVIVKYLNKHFRLLLFGVCRTIKPTGPLEGLLGGRFLTAFLACLCTGATKGVILGSIVASSERYYLLITTATAATMTMIVFLPPFLLALFSTIGFNKNSFKILLSHPELVIMPICKFLKKMHYIFNLIIL